MENNKSDKLELPLVSICSTTFNLEKYIAEAIESWLAQKTNFEFEIVICDDCSKDKTIDIIEFYIKKHPNIIRLLKAEKNQGMMPNFIWSLESAKGKYIAVCDGDDYWIDEYKLQKQIDFLENNPEYSSCFTNSLVKNEVTGEFIVAKKYIWDSATTEDFFEHNDFQNDNIPLSPGHISAFVFRNNLIKKYPDWFYKVDGVTDFPLYMMISEFGKAKFFNINTSVYRNHPKSTSTIDYELIRLENGRIFIYKCINSYFDNKYQKTTKNLIIKHYTNLYRYCFKKYNFKDGIIYYLKALF